MSPAILTVCALAALLALAASEPLPKPEAEPIQVDDLGVSTDMPLKEKNLDVGFVNRVQADEESFMRKSLATEEKCPELEILLIYYQIS